MCNLSTLLIAGYLVGAIQAPAPAIPSSSPSQTKSQVELYPASSPDETLTEKTPVNLARIYLGAKISVVNNAKGPVSTPTPPPVGLICDDVSYRYSLPAGKTTLILRLTQNIATNRFCFLVSGSEGTVQVTAATIDVDPTSSWWQPLGTKQTFVPEIQYSVEWAWSDVRYLKVEFDLKAPGSLSPLGLYGTPMVKDVKVVSAPMKDRTTTATTATSAKSKDDLSTAEQVNVASLTSHGRVSYVSSGLDRPQAASTMIDNDLGTAYTFDPEDKNPTFVVELANDHPVSRIAAYYEADSPGAWDVYPLSGLPGSEGAPATPAPKSPATAMAINGATRPDGLRTLLASWMWGQSAPQPLKLPPGFFDQNKSTQKISNKEGEPFGSIDFKPERCRFVLLRWMPDNPGASGSVKVYQVSVFTDPNEERLDAIPLVNFASLGPDLSGAHGLGGGGNNPLTQPTIPPDPPRPRPVSP